MDFTTKIDFSPGSQARKIICREFYTPKWEFFKNWLFNEYSKEDLNHIQEQFYSHLNSINQIIHFVPWFINNFLQSIHTVERDYTISGEKIIKGIFPPQNTFSINKDDIVLKFLAYQKLHDSKILTVDINHINGIIQQLNFHNLYSVIIGEQLVDLNKKLDNINNILHIKEEMSQENNIQTINKQIHATIQPPPNISGYKLENYDYFTKLIQEQMKNLSINTLDKESDTETENIQINKINYDSKFARKPVQRLYYYPRPSPQDVLTEEREYELNNSYSGKHIYEWNLDGLTEKQIYNMVHRMLMYCTIAKNSGNTDHAVAKMIVAGFTGQLKGWWDNYLSEEQRVKIFTMIKRENDIVSQNAVYTLVLNIIEHFTGRWSDDSENIRTLLNGLFCKTLTSFRWYKDTFLSRVMELNDCNSDYWKSKFIDGLPKFFAEKVRNQLRVNNIINYNDYTYGKLIGTCVREGLAVCNEIKLNYQIKTQHLNEKRQLGEFCEQFGIESSQSSKTPRKEFTRKKEII